MGERRVRGAVGCWNVSDPQARRWRHAAQALWTATVECRPQRGRGVVMRPWYLAEREDEAGLTDELDPDAL